MYALKLAQLIESRAEHLSKHLAQRLKKSDQCAELLRRVPSDELQRRSHEIYRDLSEWLLSRAESEIAKRYVGLGMRRAQQGVPYTNLLWAVSATKDYLWAFMLDEGLFAEPIDLIGEVDLLHSMDRFFDQILYFMAMGYESARCPESEQPTAAYAHS